MHGSVAQRLACSPPARLLAVAALVGGVLVAGCGGSSSPGVADVSSSSTAPGHSSTSAGAATPPSGSPLDGGGRPFAVHMVNGRNALKFSECMRANGVPNFPDPNAQGVIVGQKGAFDANSAQFQKAQKECVKRYIERGGAAPSPAAQAKQQATALAFSQCMRSHGEPDFPDPTIGSGGGVAIRLVGGSGQALDTNSPIYRKAQKQCDSLLHIPPNSGKAGP